MTEAETTQMVRSGKINMSYVLERKQKVLDMRYKEKREESSWNPCFENDFKPIHPHLLY